MNTTAIALLGYIVLMIVLVAMIAVLRAGLTISGKRKANSFSPSGEDISPFSARLCRVHANAYESFPIFGGLLIFSLVMGHGAITDGLALVLLAGRYVQSMILLFSTSIMAVNMRFAAYLVQFVISIIWVLELAKLYL
jgi:uncharacterized MAPEG superfamily protein